MNSVFEKYKNPWFSYKGAYKRKTPFFYNNEDFEWIKTIENNYSIIQPEIESFMKSKGQSLDSYFNVDLVGDNHSWKVGGFYFWGNRFNEHCSFIPKLEKLLTIIPGFVSAGISVLEPNTDIKIHNGDTDASVRAHLGLKIPMSLPNCGLEVGGIQKGWEEGKIILFNDAQQHRAWNHSSEIRYVLIIDVIRPEYLPQQKSVCANALSLIKLQQLEYKYKVVLHAPKKIKGLIRVLAKMYAFYTKKYSL